MDVLIRIGLLVLVIAGAYLAVAVWERRPASRVGELEPGVYVITGPECRLCGPVEEALRRAGLQPVVAEVGEVSLPGAPVRSLPVVLVVDEGGMIQLRRSGRAALDDVAMVAERAASLATG